MLNESPEKKSSGKEASANSGVAPSVKPRYLPDGNPGAGVPLLHPDRNICNTR